MESITREQLDEDDRLHEQTISQYPPEVQAELRFTRVRFWQSVRKKLKCPIPLPPKPRTVVRT